MRALRIPSVLALVASLALLGCGDLVTGPSVDAPQFDRAGPVNPATFRACLDAGGVFNSRGHCHFPNDQGEDGNG